MENNKAFSLREILANNHYVIPIYQRNYAWGKAEISQLMSDIFEFFDIKENNGDVKGKSYYLGTLVCFKRQDGSFELIDGQQRHTTITLINLVLKNWKKPINECVTTSNLKFDSRKSTQKFIEKLYNSIDLEKEIQGNNVLGIGNFTSAINIIQEELRERKNVIELFAKYFYGNVKLFRVEVPEDTDLNHYFEIMNNRGEQLEKHEIVKAQLMGKIDKGDQSKFAVIWDACSDMSDYIYFNFNKEHREKMFDIEGNIKTEISDFSNINLNEVTNNETENTLSEIISNGIIPDNFTQDEKPQTDKYKSIIDFPNFLLQVLKIQFKDTISLDDKKLLEHFKNNEIDSKEFIYFLLKYRTIFDKYIIKQNLSDANEEKQNWGIRKLNITYDGKIKTFENEDDEELVKLQTMLYYSNSSNTNNNWLQEILKSDDFIQVPYTKTLLQIAQSKFDNTLLTYPEITIFNLYFIDFLLWKLYKTNDVTNEILKGLKTKIEKNKVLFSNFKFRQLSSKEHLLPQSKATESEKAVLNDFGNLCLISNSQNSSANDNHPLYKRKQFNDDFSLKRLIMFESFENDKWGKSEIQAHQNDMITLLEEHYK